MHVPTLIARKREGEELSPVEIERLIIGYVNGEVADYQMSAFAMAVSFKGMSAAETAALTGAMMRSGDVFSHPPGAPVVDKHSTGGIGDKVSLILAPLSPALATVFLCYLDAASELPAEPLINWNPFPASARPHRSRRRFGYA